MDKFFTNFQNEVLSLVPGIGRPGKIIRPPIRTYYYYYHRIYQLRFQYTNMNNDSYIVIVTEYCANGDLFSYTNEYGFKNEWFIWQLAITGSQSQEICRSI